MSYIATKYGIQRGRITGQKYTLIPGRKLSAPPGDLAGLPGVEWQGSEPEPKPPEKVGVEVVIPRGARSTDYTVAEVRRIVKNVNPQDAARFIEGDPRKSVKPPR